eukprot:scaffold5551_cov159-Ochromonas_danica.AAC.3
MKDFQFRLIWERELVKNSSSAKITLRAMIYPVYARSMSKTISFILNFVTCLCRHLKQQSPLLFYPMDRCQYYVPVTFSETLRLARRDSAALLSTTDCLFLASIYTVQLADLQLLDFTVSHSFFLRLLHTVWLHHFFLLLVSVIALLSSVISCVEILSSCGDATISPFL